MTYALIIFFLFALMSLPIGLVMVLSASPGI